MSYMDRINQCSHIVSCALSENFSSESSYIRYGNSIQNSPTTNQQASQCDVWYEFYDFFSNNLSSVVKEFTFSVDLFTKRPTLNKVKAKQNLKLYKLVSIEV
ncbi:CLUMA_CG015629, isoform A [Clunio marinus]|uniref:CLUMA_CG015629, isoform A n=1 Tax=Clunio marinus TaxID=568069 RepID=A0A1J1IP68_9DIPT|nr:CLUMA_CG015629, isoform A [Clunio marinus]